MKCVVQCPGCQRRLRLPFRPGKKLHCPACQTAFVLGAQSRRAAGRLPKFLAFEVLDGAAVSGGHAAAGHADHPPAVAEPKPEASVPSRARRKLADAFEIDVSIGQDFKPAERDDEILPNGEFELLDTSARLTRPSPPTAEPPPEPPAAPRPAKRPAPPAPKRRVRRATPKKAAPEVKMVEVGFEIIARPGDPPTEIDFSLVRHVEPFNPITPVVETGLELVARTPHGTAVPVVRPADEEPLTVVYRPGDLPPRR